MKNRVDALVVAGEYLTPEEGLTEKATQRMDTAISAWKDNAADNMVISGDRSFMIDTPPSRSVSSVMKQYGVDHGVPEEAFYIEEKSLDTIGNALFTKSQIIVPQDWEHLTVVTSESHLPRTLKIFRHVMGTDFNINGMPASERVGVKEKVYEAIGVTIMREVLRGTKPGDDEAIRERLFDLVPGYAQSTKSRLAIRSLAGLIKRR
jgi:uncharacterized SAM-binding protein YcdF (DUF218 family)